MPEARERPSPRNRPRPWPRISDLFEANDEMISFVEQYQQVWDAESKAMAALAEFLHQRSESMRRLRLRFPWRRVALVSSQERTWARNSASTGVSLKSMAFPLATAAGSVGVERSF